MEVGFVMVVSTFRRKRSLDSDSSSGCLEGWIMDFWGKGGEAVSFSSFSFSSSLFPSNSLDVFLSSFCLPAPSPLHPADLGPPVSPSLRFSAFHLLLIFAVSTQVCLSFLAVPKVNNLRKRYTVSRRLTSIDWEVLECWWSFSFRTSVGHSSCYCQRACRMSLSLRYVDKRISQVDPL